MKWLIALILVLFFLAALAVSLIGLFALAGWKLALCILALILLIR